MTCNCKQIRVCSCAVPSNCVLLETIFCSCILRPRSRVKIIADRFPQLRESDLNMKTNLVSVIAKYRDLTSDLSVSHTDPLFDLLAADETRYFAQPRPIIVKYLWMLKAFSPTRGSDMHEPQVSSSKTHVGNMSLLCVQLQFRRIVSSLKNTI